MSAPKEFWDLNRCLAKLRSDDVKQQRLAALHLKAHADREIRVRTNQEFNQYMEELCKHIHDFCGSHQRSERMGGILLIRNLIDVVYAEHDLHLQKLGRYLQKIIEYKTDVNDDLPKLAAQTLGRLVQANPTSADIFDRQVRKAFTWVEDNRNEYKVYMSMLIMRELAKAAPASFHDHVHAFLRCVWTGITDQKPEIREAAKLALRQVLALMVGKKKASNSCFRLFKMAKKNVQGKSGSSANNIHGAILVIGELLAQEATKEIEVQNVFQEIGRIFFTYKDARDRVIKETIIQLMPKLARFNPEKFARYYLDRCVRHIIQEHKMQTVPARTTYTALGGVAKAVGVNIMSNMPAIISILDEGLTRGRRVGATPYLLRCIAMFAEALGSSLGIYASDLVDRMIKTGLTAESGEMLVHALTALVEHIKNPGLLVDIQKKLLAAILQILTPSSSVPTTLQSSGTRASTTQLVVPASETSSSILEVFNIIGAKTSIQDVKTQDPGLIRLALHTIGTFNFHNIPLLWFVCQCLIRYLDHPSLEIRKSACVACSQLLLRPQDPYLAQNLKKTHYRAMVYRVLEQLLTVGIADPIPQIREAVLVSLQPRFDTFLAQAENLHALFVALNDERFTIRAAAITVIGRLAMRNPAHVMPGLRKTLIHILSEMQYGADVSSQEQSCRLLGHFVESSESLSMPYLPAILNVLLPMLWSQRDPRLLSCIVETLGKLERIGGKLLKPHMPKLIEFLLNQLANRGQPIRREILLRTLGQLVRTTGMVIEPYLKFPKLLPTLLGILSTENQPATRLEVVKVLGILGALDPYTHKVNESKLRHEAEAAKQKDKKTAGKIRLQLLVTEQGRRDRKKKPERAGRVSVNPTRVKDVRHLLPSMVGNLDEFYSTVAMDALMRILAEPSLSTQHNSAMKSATYVFRSLGPRCSVFLPQLIPVFLGLLRPWRADQLSLQKQVITRLQELVSIVTKEMRPYIEDILNVIYRKWTTSGTYGGTIGPDIFDLIEMLGITLREDFKFFLPDLIPHLLRVLKSSPPPAAKGQAIKRTGYEDAKRLSSEVICRVLDTIRSFGSAVDDYLHMLIPTLVSLAEGHMTKSVSSRAVTLLGSLCSVLDIRDYISCIVHPTARIISQTKTADARDRVMAMLLAVIKQMGVDFLLFVPLINSALEVQQRRAVQQKWDQKERNRLSICVDGYNSLVDIIMRGETPTKLNLNKALKMFGANNTTHWEPHRQKIMRGGPRESTIALYERKLSIDVGPLQKTFECKNKVTREDWQQWMKNFMVKLLEFSPSPALRGCVTLAKRDQQLARDLFNAAFLSVWMELTDTTRDQLVVNLQYALQPTTPKEILQSLLNLAEFMEREGRSLPILQDESKGHPTLGNLAERCHAFAKALHYKEIEFKTAPHRTIESLISVNNDLQQPDAAVGILICAQKMREMKLKPSWYEKLQRWEDALEEYEVLQLREQKNVSHTLGRMRCMDALGLWQRLALMCDHIWSANSLSDSFINTRDSEINVKAFFTENQVLDIASFGASASWELCDWEGMVKYVRRLPEGKLDTSIFKTVLAIQRKDYKAALLHITQARHAVYTDLCSLVEESYNRAYGHMVKVQVLAELEEVVEYKSTKKPEDRNRIRSMWEQRLHGTQRDITVWRHILAARKLVLRPSEQIETVVNFSALARKSQRLALSLRALTPFMGEEKKMTRSRHSKPLDVKLPLEYPRVCLAYLSHLWDAGYDKKRLVKRLETLVEDLNPKSREVLVSSPRADDYSWAADAKPQVQSNDAKTEDDITRMECYLRLGQWRRQLFGESPQNLEKVLLDYKWAASIRADKYKAWHAYASVHFRLVSLYHTKANRIKGHHRGTSENVRQSYMDLPSAVNLMRSSSTSETILEEKMEQGTMLNIEDTLKDCASPKGQLRHCKIMIRKHVVPAIEGFFRAIALAGANRSTLQDVLRLLTLWFNQGGSEHPEVNQALSKGFNTTSIDTWLKVIPQIIARIETPDSSVRKLVEQLLRKIGKEHPQALIYPLTVASKSSVTARRKAAEGIMNHMRKYNAKLVEQAQLISTELIRVAILWHEMWHVALEDASKYWFGKRNVQGMLSVVEPLHLTMEKGPQTMRETAFQQSYGKILLEAKDWCDRFKVTQNESDLNQAWDAYCTVWRRINKYREMLVSVDLQHASPKLKNVRNLELAVPGTYERVLDEGKSSEVVRIAYFQPKLKVIESKQRPRRLSIIGSDGVEYGFLLKGHEDLRQDERVMQLFGLVNMLLATDEQTTQKNLSIHRYSVIPLAPTSGLIQWLQHCDTLHSLIKEYRDTRYIMVQVEMLLIKLFSNKLYESSLSVIQKIEVFEYALSKTSGLDLYHVLWLKSEDSETWLDRRTNYTRSLAVMSMVGYILGLGDRHPCNLMLDQFTGKIIHIDFGDCFEVAMQREKFPEKIPFRLTRMLVNAMEVSGIEGNFRSTCEAVMRVLRTNKESVMAVLEAFVYDPLINWRLLQTKVSRLHENPEQNEDDNEDKVLSEESDALLGDEAQETKEAGEAVLNEKALTVIGRIASKLDGMDFGDGEALNVPQQVEKLIRQATSHVNLSQCYIGWCPFW